MPKPTTLKRSKKPTGHAKAMPLNPKKRPIAYEHLDHFMSVVTSEFEQLEQLVTKQNDRGADERAYRHLLASIAGRRSRSIRSSIWRRPCSMVVVNASPSHITKAAVESMLRATRMAFERGTCSLRAEDTTPAPHGYDVWFRPLTIAGIRIPKEAADA